MQANFLSSSSQKPSATTSDPNSSEFNSEKSPNLWERSNLQEKYFQNISFLVGFSKKLLRQSKLSYIEPEDIIHEALFRAHKAIRDGKGLDKFKGWMCGTIINIIREKTKEEIKQEKIAQKMIYESSLRDENTLGNYSSIDKNVENLCLSLNKMEEEDKLILIMRKVQGDSWQEIGDFFVNQNKSEENDEKLQNCLRQKGKRALDKLRNSFKA